MKVNLHAHTVRCNHATGTEREYIENAIAAGLDVLGFSDHAPMPFKGEYYSHFRMRPHEIDSYVQTLLKLKEEYASKIKVLIGFEAEYYPSLFDDFLAMIEPYPIDYLIYGQHAFEEEEGGIWTGQPTDDESLLCRYVDHVIKGLNTGVYTYLAHPDLIHYTGPDDIYFSHMRRLCTCAKELDIPLEINLLGIWEKRHYPADRFWHLVKEMGNRVVLGIDAHQAERIGEKEVLEKGLALAERCGLTLSEPWPVRSPKRK